MNFGEIPAFKDTKASKEQFVKLLEESAEVYSAWERLRDNNYDFACYHRELVSECIDVVQVIVNILDSIGVAAPSAYVDEMIQKNTIRGRYETLEEVNEGWV